MDLIGGILVALLATAPDSAVPLPGMAVTAASPRQVAASDERPTLAEIAGIYRVEGRNTEGSRYTGRVQVTIEEQKVLFRWEIGRDIFRGEGTLNGDVLTVYWGQPEPVIYILRSDGRLQGSWAAGRATEVLTPLR